MRGAVVVLAGLLLSGPAHAYLKAGPAGYGHWLQATTVQQGMTTSLAGAYSFRKVRDAYAGSAVKLKRTTGGTLDVGFTASGDFDSAAAAVFCAATTCDIEVWYDQSGLARDAIRVSANGPLYVADCGGGRPCARGSTGTDYVQVASIVWGVAKSTISVVARRASGTGICYWTLRGSNNLRAEAAGQWMEGDGAGSLIGPAAPEGVFHAGIGVIDGASSVVRTDASETTGTLAGSTASGTLVVAYAASLPAQCDVAEALVWNNYALTQPERLALAENQRNYYMPLPLDTFAMPAAAFSMRRLKSAYTGPGIRLRRASDNAEADIGFLGFTGFTGAPLDTVAAQAHCAATSCTVVTWYDQSGNARHALLQGAEVPPAYVADCNGSLPCARTTGDQRLYTSGTITPTYPVTLGAVANRSAGGGNCFVPNHYGSSYLSAWGAVPNQWVLVGNAAGSVGAGAADAGWHAGVGVVNGASSTLRIDGAETAGSTTGAVAASVVIPLWGSPDTTCNAAEVLVWNTYALTATERAALTANQRNFWAIP